MPQVDPEPSGRGQLQAELTLQASPYVTSQKAIRQIRELRAKRLRNNLDIRRLVEDCASFVDNILQQTWEQCDWSNQVNITLVAVDSCSQGELHPYSDLNPLPLFNNADHAIFHDSIRALYGADLGHQSRSKPEHVLGGRVHKADPRRPDHHHRPDKSRTVAEHNVAVRALTESHHWTVARSTKTQLLNHGA